MKMREEIDALHTMGFDPIEVLILPRIDRADDRRADPHLPRLVWRRSMAAGWWLALWRDEPRYFLSRLKEAISLKHFEVGMIKAPFMALVIGIVACVEGLAVKGSPNRSGCRPPPRSWNRSSW